MSLTDQLINKEHLWNDADRGEPWYSDKNLSQCHFVHQKSQMNWPVIQRGCQLWRLRASATARPSTIWRQNVPALMAQSYVCPSVYHHYLHKRFINLHSMLTYLLTPWSSVILEKLTGLQLVKKFPALYGTRRFITAVTTACHLSLSWAISIQTMPHIPFPEDPS